jgi:hypothetical protein
LAGNGVLAVRLVRERIIHALELLVTVAANGPRGYL